MSSRLGELVTGWVTACVRLSQRQARRVLWLNLAVGLGLAAYAGTHLGVNADNKRLLDPDLPFQQAAAAFHEHFPSMDDALLVVVDAASPDAARAAARALAAHMEEQRDTFHDVYLPAGDPFFEEHGLLYRSVTELDDFADHLARLQPVIAELTLDPSIGNLTALVKQGLQSERNSSANPEQWAAVLDRVRQATVQVFRDYPVAVSWEEIMLQGSALDPGSRQVIIAEPVLEFGKPLAAARSMDAIRSAARDLGLVPERGVTVRITGNPALSYEEVINLAWDVGVSSLLSFALVTILLWFALHSLRLVSAAALTLLSGIVLTAAFAAATVGELNLVSISFAVLFIGLGVDFAIHLSMHFIDGVHAQQGPSVAMERASRRIGASLVLCGLTTAIGFFAFVPTEYRGVAELGLISGGGMFVIVIQTLTLFPALTVVLMNEQATEQLRRAKPLRLAIPTAIGRYPGGVACIALVLGSAAAVQLTGARFDCNVVTMRDPRTESVQAFNDLLASSATSPWSVDAMARDLDSARALAERMRRLDVVESAATIEDYVPEEQDEKIEVLRDASLLLDVPETPGRGSAAPETSEQIAALRALRDLLGAEWLTTHDAGLARSAVRLRDHLTVFVERVEVEPDPAAALEDLQSLLLGNFSAQIDRLRRALEAEPVTRADLPEDLRHRMLSDDGYARVQVFPRDDLSDTAALERFVDAVHVVDPQATGVAVNILAFGRATAGSLRQALVTAFVAITVVLLVLWWRPLDAALALTPLALGAALTGGLMVALDIPFNFANVIVLPLLLGIGVDSGIHIVQGSRDVAPGAASAIDPTTARAVFFSAVTTTASFGSLAFSHHRGIASMGFLLVCGMLIMLVCNLVVLPALIALRGRWGGGPNGNGDERR